MGLFIKKIIKIFLFLLIATVTGFLTPIALAYIFPREARYGWRGGEYGGVHSYMIKHPLSRLNVSEWIIGNFDENSGVMQSVNINPDDFFEIDISISKKEKNYFLFRLGGPEISDIIVSYRLEFDDQGKPKESKFSLCADDCNVNRSIYEDRNTDGIIDTFSVVLNERISRFVLFNDMFVPVASTHNDLWWIQIEGREVPVCFDGNAWVICEACE